LDSDFRLSEDDTQQLTLTEIEEIKKKANCLELFVDEGGDSLTVWGNADQSIESIYFEINKMEDFLVELSRDQQLQLVSAIMQKISRGIKK